MLVRVGNESQVFVSQFEEHGHSSWHYGNAVFLLIVTVSVKCISPAFAQAMMPASTFVEQGCQWCPSHQPLLQRWCQPWQPNECVKVDLLWSTWAIKDMSTSLKIISKQQFKNTYRVETKLTLRGKERGNIFHADTHQRMMTTWRPFRERGEVTDKETRQCCQISKHDIVASLDELAEFSTTVNNREINITVQD